MKAKEFDAQKEIAWQKSCGVWIHNKMGHVLASGNLIKRKVNGQVHVLLHTLRSPDSPNPAFRRGHTLSGSEEIGGVQVEHLVLEGRGTNPDFPKWQKAWRQSMHREISEVRREEEQRQGIVECNTQIDKIDAMLNEAQARFKAKGH